MDLRDFKKTRNAGAAFVADSTGYIIGNAQGISTAIRKEAGVFNPATTAQVPYIWGGRLISARVGQNGQALVDLSVSAGNVDGIAVHTNSGVSAPNSQVPQVAAGDFTQFYRKGSGARIALAATPALAAQLVAGTIFDASWDFANNRADQIGMFTDALSAMGMRIIAVDAMAQSKGVALNGTNTNWQDGVCAIVVEL